MEEDLLKEEKIETVEEHRERIDSIELFDFKLQPKPKKLQLDNNALIYLEQLKKRLHEHPDLALPPEQASPLHVGQKQNIERKRDTDKTLAIMAQLTEQEHFNDIKMISTENDPHGYTTIEVHVPTILPEKMDKGLVNFAEYYDYVIRDSTIEHIQTIRYFWEKKPPKRAPQIVSRRQLYEVVGIHQGKTLFTYLPQPIKKPGTIRLHGYFVRLEDVTLLGKGKNAATCYPAFIAEEMTQVRAKDYTQKEEQQLDNIWLLAQKLKNIPLEQLDEYLWQSITYPYIHTPYSQDKKLLLAFFLGANDQTLGGDFPIHIAYIGLPGVGRTRRLIRLAQIMDDIILTAGTSTGLLPNYGSEVPNPGAIISRSGDYCPIVTIDELWKSVGSAHIEKRTAGFGKITNILTCEFFEASSGKGTQKLQNKTRIIFGDNMKKGSQDHIMDNVLDRYPYEFCDRILIIPQNQEWLNYVKQKKHEINEEIKKNSKKLSHGGLFQPQQTQRYRQLFGKKLLKNNELNVLFYFTNSSISILHPNIESSINKEYNKIYKQLESSNPVINNWSYSRLYEHFKHLVEAFAKLRKLKELCLGGFKEYFEGRGLLEVDIVEEDILEAEDVLEWVVELWKNNSSALGSTLLVEEIVESVCSRCGEYMTTGKTIEGDPVCRKCARKLERKAKKEV